MARKRKSNNSTQKASSARARAAPIPKECSFCHDLIVKRLADHERICKFNSIARRQAAKYRLSRRLRDSNAVKTPNATAGSSHSPTDDSVRPQLSSPCPREPSPMDVDSPPPPETGDMQLPGRFIYVKHHPHSGKPNEIIPLDSTGSLNHQHELAPKPAPGALPWAPFKCLADATFASLRQTEWADGPRVTFANHREMERSLDAAREGNVRFHKTQVSIDFEGRELGGTYSVEIQFRDPWDVMKRWLRDETLGSALDTGTTWGAVDDSLPANDKYPACYMHPFLLRGCWIHSATRNGSGNGGAALLGFVVMPAALREIDPKTLKGGRRTEYDTLKAQTQDLSQIVRGGHGFSGSPLAEWVAHPGILIESMDFEEVAAWLAIRNSRSLHPCPKCLVHHNDLHKLFECSVRRTPELMKDVLRRAARLKATEREELLKSYGLHNFKLFLWKFKHSAPSAATCYDLLHYFDGGKWGRHVWVLIKEYLQSEGLASKFNDYMNRFPRWRDLKHFPSPTTIDYAEGQAFVDILKKLRTMLGLEVTTGTRLDHVKDLVREYKLGSDEVSDNHGKDFNFLKQHSLSHSIDDL
ncbi:hypothetical protein C8R46DRAFT_1249130 [Mycena filopes]|nr:hypothetical protein C8R46DRAFT_1249130 [Mycena filopes]